MSCDQPSPRKPGHTLRLGQSISEYAVLISAVVGALVIMNGYMTGAFNSFARGLQVELNGAIKDQNNITDGDDNGGSGHGPSSFTFAGPAPNPFCTPPNFLFGVPDGGGTVTIAFAGGYIVNSHYDPGNYTVRWDGSSSLASGVYPLSVKFNGANACPYPHGCKAVKTC